MRLFATTYREDCVNPKQEIFLLPTATTSSMLADFGHVIFRTQFRVGCSSYFWMTYGPYLSFVQFPSSSCYYQTWFSQ
jgi:hypothetical protein